MRTFGPVTIPETASEIKAKMVEAVRLQLREVEPNGVQYILHYLSDTQLEAVIDFITSFDDERAIPEFEAYEESLKLEVPEWERQS
jgi:hypothetical protein